MCSASFTTSDVSILMYRNIYIKQPKKKYYTNE